MCPERIDQRLGERDDALAGPGRDVGELGTMTGPLGAIDRPLGAGRRASATVAVTRPGHRLADGHGPGVPVDVGPGQGECLTLAQSGGQGEDPARGVSSSTGRDQQAARLVSGQRLDLLRYRRGCVDERAHVAADEPALHGHDQGPGQAPVDLQCAGAVEARPLQPDQERLDVLRSQISQSDTTCAEASRTARPTAPFVAPARWWLRGARAGSCGRPPRGRVDMRRCARTRAGRRASARRPWTFRCRGPVLPRAG